MGFFLKLTTLLGHAKDIASHLLALADKGMAIDQHILDKAKAIEGTIEKFIPAQQAAPTTIMLPVPDAHAATLGATPLGGK